MAKSAPTRERQTHPPEKKFGPYPGGIGVAVWNNTVEFEGGLRRQIRSITISPRRYRDPETGDWRDSPSFRPGDLPALIFALQKTLEYIYTSPLANEDGDHEAGEEF